ncbi:MAG: M14 family zinc carboxypeptidase [Armatimonadetes bacterium]|nr:M14 family zinc carboxypeptidase [Armatimonadota bacterium]
MKYTLLALASLFFAAPALGLPQPLLPGLAPRGYPGAGGGGYQSNGRLLTFAQIEQRIAAWKKKYPELIEISALPGKTREGRRIPLVRIGKPGQPELMWLSGIHPREQQPAYCTLRFLEEELAVGWKSQRCLWYVPMFNVDGKLWEETHKDWRKNRVGNGDGTFGVDLNRNFPVRWGGGREIDSTWNDSTARPGADIFEGLAALSEPENQALDAFFAAHPQLRAFMDIHSPLREILFPAHSIAPDHARYLKIVTGMQQRQSDSPYSITKSKPGSEPAPGVRGGNSGLTYTHAYYSYGIYGFNFEISIPSKAKGVAGRYPSERDVAKEYETNVKEAWRFWLETAGELPLAQRGTLKLEGSGTTDKPITPNATLGWTPPIITGGAWSYAVLTSQDPAIVVPSEYRSSPLQNPFTIQVMPDAKPGTSVPMTLHLWDSERRHSTYKFRLEVLKKE